MIKKKSTLKKPLWWNKAIKHLQKVDVVQNKLISNYAKTNILYRHSTPFATLAKSIVGQQISVAAAARIRERLDSQGYFLFPKQLKQAPLEKLRSLGLSRQKALYLKALATWFVTKKIQDHWFFEQNSKTIEQELIDIPGIGPWTLQMFQIFYLLEPNVLPINDLGLQKAVVIAYSTPKSQAKKKLQTLAKNVWFPYITTAVWFLWRSLDTEKTQ